MLPDPERKITDTLYHADLCPRTVVVEPKGIFRYVNRGPCDKSREAPATLIVANTLTALRDRPARENQQGDCIIVRPVDRDFR